MCKNHKTGGEVTNEAIIRIHPSDTSQVLVGEVIFPFYSICLCMCCYFVHQYSHKRVEEGRGEVSGRKKEGERYERCVKEITCDFSTCFLPVNTMMDRE